jgi:hypothetical protein
MTYSPHRARTEGAVLAALMHGVASIDHLRLNEEMFAIALHRRAFRVLTQVPGSTFLEVAQALHEPGAAAEIAELFLEHNCMELVDAERHAAQLFEIWANERLDNMFLTLVQSQGSAVQRLDLARRSIEKAQKAITHGTRRNGQDMVNPGAARDAQSPGKSDKNNAGAGAVRPGIEAARGGK